VWVYRQRNPFCHGPSRLASDKQASEAYSISGSDRCPNCGHVLFSIDLPIATAVQARDVSPPDAPLLLRVAEAARLLGVSRRCTSWWRQARCRGPERTGWPEGVARLARAVVPRNFLVASRASVQVLQRHPSRGLLRDERLHLLGEHAMWVTRSGVQPRA